MLKPILTYVKKQSLCEDLENREIKLKKDNMLIRWRVNGIGEESGACWANERLFKAFSDWYKNERREKYGDDDFCMVLGERTIPAKNHMKGVVSHHGNAKLISSDDNDNFTYRGRFNNANQAASVGYDASQKAHNALKWLVDEQGSGAMFGKRTFLCWNPKGKKVPHCVLPFETAGTAAVTPSDYKAELRKTLSGWRVQLPKNCGGVVIASLDVATDNSGRLAVTYYNELMASDFLQRLHDWDESCCWWRYNPNSRRFDAIGSPSFMTLISCAYGVQRGEKNTARLEVNDKLLRMQMQRLVACRVDRAAFPRDLMRRLFERACSPQSFESNIYKQILRTACAAVKKYYHDVKKVELPMTLDDKLNDVSYQFGRLLAVLDRAELDCYWEKEKITGQREERQTNAAKYMTKFQQKPLETYMRIYEKVNEAYLSRIPVSCRVRFDRLNGEILGILEQFPKEELNKPLKETFLLGFYSQRSKFYEGKEETEED